MALFKCKTVATLLILTNLLPAANFAAAQEAPTERIDLGVLHQIKALAT